MKTIFTALTILAFSFSNAQIKKVELPESEVIGKVAQLGNKSVELTKRGNTYTLFYRDIKFKTLTEWKSFSFDDEDDALNSLYNIIIEGFANPPKDAIIIELPNDTIFLHFIKSMGVVNLQIHHFVKNNPNVIGESTYMIKRQVDKLFGK